MPRRKTNSEIIRSKIDDGGAGNGSMDYKPPSYGRGIVKNGEEDTGEVPLEETLLRSLISEIVRKCGDDWCLYTKKKDPKSGKRRRLGTHSSKAAAYRQERAIKTHGG
jgi:hypothetical protein